MGAPFIHSGRSSNWFMRQALWAMIPGIALLTIFFGRDILFNLLIASISAILFELIILRLRKLPLLINLQDSSALVTAWLLAVSVPATLSPWLLILGVFFAIVIAKHLYGGLGHNLFNPAMVGFVVLLISFPLSMSQWPLASYPMFFNIDAISEATPLDSWHTKHLLRVNYAWLLINLGWLIGGLYLVIRKLAAWQTILGFLLSLIVLTQFQQGLHFDINAFLMQLFSGGTMLAAFFIVTDPVTSSTTPWGRFIFGAGTGLLTFLIRLKGGYPDGIAFSVLLMNCTVPLLDKYTKPRLFGRKVKDHYVSKE
jgi:electron transport complex protein RnfD